ncbi:hypothetical protein P168DRAFT_322623 [Aspergillus campestris IBT 28561]|uniref:Uncharacterized protein n=1 Tax=Aspergillus campestris (strain IBT 28561) TaxID=1392248 RepID=A0A2I1CRC1_ASPC2|nr:uncharacterized protein P168DRAFT_322623 [Aspergillus campestris IBT 28561]PKY00172.1 hypothetical protein P168DRAFT_322623 [Aspergillus campestris IBT 28561]
MSSILSTLGLHAAASGAAPPNHAVGYIVANWFFAYLATSARASKMWLGLDHNSAPREDLAKYGEAAVQSGKISRGTLNRLKRQEAAHANAVEGFPLFIAAMLLGIFAGLPTETINGIGAWYSVSRLLFTVSYALTESEGMSFLRSAFWFSGNIGCIAGLLEAAKTL